MSHPHDSGAHPRAETDRVNSRAVLLVGFAALAVFILAGGASIGYIRHRNAVTPQAALPAEVGQSKVGLVEQRLFNTDLRGTRDAEVRRARLDGYGWVDRPAGLVHIPIDRAMELVAQGVRVPAGEVPPPPPIGAANGGVDAPGATPPTAPAGVTSPRARGGKRP